MMAELATEKIIVPEGCNIIFGQAHFIRTAEHLYSALIESVPGIKFGLAFAEASGDCLVRTEGTDDELRQVAGRELAKIGAGHTFLIVLRNAFPINVLNQVKATAEVASVYCASANPVEVVLAQTVQGRGVLGVVDGASSKGVEQAADVAKRREFLKKIGYTPK
jgi:adenosine/AMP kinase